MLANIGLVSQDYGRYELTVRENEAAHENGKHDRTEVNGMNP